MSRIKLRRAPRYPDDCKRIAEVALKAGYAVSMWEAEAIWDAYSDSMAAGWMGLPDDDEELMSIVESYAEVDES
jgi:hypothetical protein